MHNCARVDSTGGFYLLVGLFSMSILYFSSSKSFCFRNEVTSNSFLNTVVITKTDNRHTDKRQQVAMSVISATQEAEAGRHQFKVCLGYSVS